MLSKKLDPKTREKWILSFLFLGGRGRDAEERVLGRTRLMKELFLVDRYLEARKGIKTEMRFEPYRFGPSDSGILICLQNLMHDQLVYGKKAPGHDVLEFSLSTRGIKKARQCVEQLKPDEIGTIRRIKSDYNFLPQRDLLKYVYKQYPQYAVKSEIRNQVLGRHNIRLFSDQMDFEFDKDNLLEEIMSTIDMAEEKDSVYEGTYIYSIKTLKPINIRSIFDISDFKECLPENQYHQLKGGYVYHEILYNRDNLAMLPTILERLFRVSEVLDISLKPSKDEYRVHKRIELRRPEEQYQVFA